MATTTVTVPAEVKKGLAYNRQSNTAELETREKTLNEAIESLNEVANGDDLKEQRTAHDKVDNALKSYNEYKTLVEYENFMETSDPMKTALIAGYITLKKVSSEDNLGITSYKAEDTDAQIDFIAFNGFTHSMDKRVQLRASQLGYMVLLAKGVADGNSAAAITTAYQKAKGRPISKVYKSAPSKNDLKESLQELLDSIYFEDNGKGLNKFMVTTEWLNWFSDAINRTGYGKGYLSRTGKNPKQIVQTAAALYNAYFNKYGIRTVADGTNFVLGGFPDEKKSKKKATKAA